MWSKLLAKYATLLHVWVQNLNPQVMQSNDLKVDESSLTGESDQVQIFQSKAKTQSYLEKLSLKSGADHFPLFPVIGRM